MGVVFGVSLANLAVSLSVLSVLSYIALVLKFEAIVLEFSSRAKPKELGESLVGVEMVPVDSAIVLVPVLPEPVVEPEPVT